VTDIAGADARRVIARLTRIGFADPIAASQLMSTGPLLLWSPPENAAVDDASAAVLSSLGRAADPDLAVRMLAQLAATEDGKEIVAELRESPEFRTRLIGLLGASVTLAEHLVLHPSDALVLRGSRAELPTLSGAEARIADAVLADAATPVTGSEGQPAGRVGPAGIIALRTAYRRELVLIAGQDLAGELPLQHVMEALASLADYTLRAALAVARAGLPKAIAGCRLAIIAMGKTGGRELNYVSDVDVIFVAEPRADVAESDALAAASRLASETMKICGLVAWEVDAGLRPEGNDGVLVRTLASHQAYYRRWAATWEFQALLKARSAAGDLELGEQYLNIVSPFIWSAAERPDFVTDVQAMRRRVVKHLPQGIAEREIKLGAGGLRDVEFAVQLLQLVHGRSDESLRVRATLPALAALRDGGYVGVDDAYSLGDAYEFLRCTEHRLQLRRLRRTHLIPEDPEDIRRLGRSLGLRPDDRGDAADVWRAEWARHALQVRRLHEKLFYRPLLEAVSRVKSADLRLSADEARRRLEALGFTDPVGALRHLQALTAGVSRRAAIQRTLLPVMLPDFADAPDPDAGLLAYRQVSDALGETPWFLRLLRDEGAVASRLATLLGTSRFVAHLLVRAPEALQMLADDNQLVPRRRGEIEVVMSTGARRQPDPSRAAHAIRAVRRVELLRIAFADLLGLLDDSQVRVALSELTDATLSAAVLAARKTVSAELGIVDLDIDFAVIAVGRLGGQEVGYGSDADVLFVYSATGPGSGADAGRQATAVAERVRGMLSASSTDPPLPVDANLRPEGRNGPLVRSLDSYAEYYARWSSVWEAQALLRARPCAGSSELAERFIDLIEDLRYPVGGLAPAGVAEIRRIKGRVDAERLPRGADPNTHLKLGRGGLADVEWTVQLIQLCYAWEVPGLRSTATLGALLAATESGHIAADDALALEAAWRLASRARDAIMLVRDHPEDQLPKPGRVLIAVGRVLGYQPGFDTGQLIDDYRRTGRRARRVVESVFYG
jgi:glutamate-ammonia-ligase adenylyltransferase